MECDANDNRRVEEHREIGKKERRKKKQPYIYTHRGDYMAFIESHGIFQRKARVVLRQNRDLCDSPRT